MTDFQDRLNRITLHSADVETARQRDPGLLAERAKELKKRRHKTANIVSTVIGTPVLIGHMILAQETVEAWFYRSGLLPEYGVMKLAGYDGPINWDTVVLSGLTGGLIFGLIWLAVYPFVKLVVR